MTPEEIQAYKEQMFSGNGQSSIQAPKPEQVDTAPATETQPPAAATVVEDTTAPPTIKPDDDDVVDDFKYLKENLGYNNLDEAKADIAALRQKAETPAEIKFANEQSQKLFNAIKEGNTKQVYEVLAQQERLSAVETMSADDALKLHIKETNPHYGKDDVADIFEEKYAYPEKPVQTDLEEDSDFKARVQKWDDAKAKIDRRKERDSVTAKTELAKLKTELILPDIHKQPEADADYVAWKQAQQSIPQKDADTKEAYSKMSTKDVAMVFKFNDEANKLAFDISYEADKDSFDEAVKLASDLPTYLSNYYDKDGSPDRAKFLKDLYAGRNIEKIVTEAVKAATNETKAWFLKNQKNIGDGLQKNYSIAPETEVQKLKKQVFG